MPKGNRILRLFGRLLQDGPRIRSRTTRQEPAGTESVSENSEVSRKGVQLAFFPGRSEVIRLTSGSRYSSDYLELRDDFSLRVRSVRVISVSEHENCIVEEYVRGEKLSALPRDSAAFSLAAKAVMRSLKAHALQAGQSDGTADFVGRVQASGIEEAQLKMGEILDLLAPIKCISSHGDLHSDNIIVTGEPLQPVAIDFDSIRLRPSWFDGVRFMQFEVGRPARRRHDGRLSRQVIGELDAELAQMIRTGVQGGKLPKNWRSLVSLAYLAWRQSERQHLSSSVPEPKVVKDAKDLEFWVNATK